ncbi:2Fe-2S iron-sulfur cluster-binding protein [Aquimarina sp. ERC-38]|uniref:(2Fe-2S)-binding protein n=1 Tax=Aquimarina sp. ERC-38 TaxID=2949996 RepID=UPI002246F163|nr:2Fe-2S iron-sulfur cluster-binding protein [Aquimarina sp. ERC-38]UZO81037.1 2Fe-2S iron-sulfur cluster-binding protein [Aquimarina sp. ERC-38]
MDTTNDKNEKPSQNGKKGLSRRGFLKGTGLATAGTFAFTNSLFANEASTDTLAIAGPDANAIELTINDRKVTTLARPDETLVDVLRERLEMTGTKMVCGRGACSACTVMIDDEPVCSCLTLAVEVQDKKITTIEGIAKDGKLHPVQEAFIEEDAAMCGYCTPGMVMSCVHLVDNTPNPTIEEVKHAVRGNLCRCGTYPHVFKAAMTASKNV